MRALLGLRREYSRQIVARTQRPMSIVRIARLVRKSPIKRLDELMGVRIGGIPISDAAQSQLFHQRSCKV
jgi:hypothetical protein